MRRHARARHCARLPAPPWGAAVHRSGNAKARVGNARHGCWAVVLAAAGLCAAAGQAYAQPAAPATAPAAAPATEAVDPRSAQGRRVREVRLEGLSREPASLVRNQLRTTAGAPFDAGEVRDDVARLERLGRFQRISADILLREAGAVDVVFRFVEQPLVQDVQIVGNTKVNAAELAKAIAQLGIVKDAPIDEFRIGRAQRLVEEQYRKKGFFAVKATVDESELADKGIVLIRVREGQRVRVMAVRFAGVQTVSEDVLRSKIKATKVRGLFNAGPLNEENIQADIGALLDYFKAVGMLDARVDRRITPSPDGTEAIVTFLVDEGPRYLLRELILRPAEPGTDLVFTADQLEGLMELRKGGVFGEAARRRSIQAVRAAYHGLGYAQVRVVEAQLRVPDAPFVDLALTVNPGPRLRTGEIIIQGNDLTRHDVIRREITLKPGVPLDPTELRTAERRLEALRLFERGGARATIQPEDPKRPGERDVLIEIQEASTGRLNYGATVSSDLGLAGVIQYQQQNFDISDTPETLAELLSNRAFYGGGQSFDVQLSPGSQLQQYKASLTEPYFLGSDISLATGLGHQVRRFSDHDEARTSATLGVGRRFGERWTANVGLRAESVALENLDANAPVDLFAVADRNQLYGISLRAVRNTVPREQRLAPARGVRTQLAVEQVFGDFEFTRLSAEQGLWLPLYEDYLGRTGVFSVRVAAGWIPQEHEAPTYERLYQGGRGFRGFSVRGVSPVGVRNDTGAIGDDPVGGAWSFFAGAQYEHPLFGAVEVAGRTQAQVAVAVFIDSGTVEETIGFAQYRVAVGAGIRIRAPALSGAPLAFDFAIPLQSEATDDERIFTFTIDLPF